MDAFNLTALVSQTRFDDGVGHSVLRLDAIGLGGAYDLGGGASVKGGVVRLSGQEPGFAKDSDTAFDLGVAFTF